MRTRLGHYDIVAELGRGGMGVVYKGYEASLNRYVAIKVLAESLAHDDAIKERFLREARSMAALNDAHIIQIYFIGEDDGQTYFVMEFVEGESLGSMLKREGRLSVEQSAKVIQQTALGLATAHDRGVVHRDIKPGNLMITSRGTVKIADFGIALSNHDLSKKLTTTGEFVGTPGYLSPEVCLGKPVDQRSDIFSLGIVLFEMLTGKMPFNDESPLGLMLEVVRAEIPDVRALNADVDAQIAGVLTKMIAKDPAERYADCHALVADLERHPLVAKGGPITARAKLSPAAATLIGQKTPISGQATLPSTPTAPLAANTRITPPAQPAPPPLATAPAHRSVLERPSAAGAPRRSALPWAIAALVLLGLAGGAYAYRGRIAGVGAAFAPTDASAQARTADASSDAADAARSASDSIRASIVHSDATPPPPAPPAQADAVADSAPARTAKDATADAVPANDAAVGAAAAIPAPPADRALAAAAPAGAGGAADADAAGAGAAEAAPQAVRDADAAPATPARAPADATHVATAPRPAPPPKPHVPTVA
ncbi:MAG TPA: serine/threonine-protein kinase, partial [Dokdonella sp.]